MPSTEHRRTSGPASHRTSPDLHRTAGGLALLLFALAVGPAAAQQDHRQGEEHAHDHEQHDHRGLHFTHPLIAESVSPDRKIRIDHQFFDFPDGDTEHSGVLEAEFAFHRSISFELGLPYSYSATEFGNLEAKLKFANFAFEDAGVLLGYGVGLVFPTNGAPAEAPPAVPETSTRTVASARRDPSNVVSGFPSSPPVGRRADGLPSSPPGPRLSGGGAGVEGSLGTEEWELEPFLNVGFKEGRWELVGWTIFGIPFQQEEQAEVATELGWNVSALFHASSRVQALLELDGSGGISGEPVGEDVLFASPGLRVQPFDGQPLWLGSSVGFPLATGVEEDPFDIRWKTSLFWHFPM